MRLTGRDDDGVTMVEMMVVTAILSVVTAIGTTGIVAVLRQQRASVAFTDAQTQAARALQRMDGEIRYAGDLTVFTGTTARAELPDPSLVWVAVDPDSATSALRCVALSLSGDSLQRREWAGRPASVAVATAVPATLVQGVRTVAGLPPFAVTGGPRTVAGDGDPVVVVDAKAAQLNLRVVAGDTAGSRVLLQQFVALNSRQGTYDVSAQCF